MKPIRLLLMLFPLLLLLAAPAMADDVCVVQDASAATAISTDCSYLRVCAPLTCDAPVTLSIRDGWGGLVYQRDYGVCRGSFRSEDVYLRLDGSSASYQVTLNCGEAVYRFRVTRIQPRMTDSSVCASGLPLSRLTGRSGNKTAVVIDADMLSGGSISVPLVSGGMQVGFATFSVSRGELTVSASLTVDGQIEKSTVYVARDAVTAATLGTNRFTGTKTKLDRSVDLRGTPYAAVLVQLTVSYDAATAWPCETDSRYLQEQLGLWDLMQMTTANEAVG